MAQGQRGQERLAHHPEHPGTQAASRFAGQRTTGQTRKLLKTVGLLETVGGIQTYKRMAKPNCLEAFLEKNPVNKQMLATLLATESEKETNIKFICAFVYYWSFGWKAHPQRQRSMTRGLLQEDKRKRECSRGFEPTASLPHSILGHFEGNERDRCQLGVNIYI